MSDKSIRDRIINLLLLIYIINKANQIAKVENNLKLQKLTFLAEKLLNERQRKGLSYIFIRWNMGPFSANINNDLALLKNSNFVDWGRDKITLTSEGKNLLSKTSKIFDSNKTILNYVDVTIEKNARLSPEEIKDKVYDIAIRLPRVGRIMRIREVPPRNLLLCGLSEKRAKYSFEIQDSWLDTLEVVFDEEAMNMLRNAEQDAITGRCTALYDI